MAKRTHRRSYGKHIPTGRHTLNVKVSVKRLDTGGAVAKACVTAGAGKVSKRACAHGMDRTADKAVARALIALGERIDSRHYLNTHVSV